MAKVFLYAVILVGILTLFSMAGINTASHQIYDAMFGNSDVKLSEFYVKIQAIFAIFIGASIIIGVFTKQSTESYVVAGFAGIIFGWIIADLYSITTIPDLNGIGFASNLVKLIIYPLMAGFCIAIIAWWRGADG
jgi:hypothetical protein